MVPTQATTKNENKLKSNGKQEIKVNIATNQQLKKIFKAT